VVEFALPEDVLDLVVARLIKEDVRSVFFLACVGRTYAAALPGWKQRLSWKVLVCRAAPS
jgi:hypothetical protein